MSKIRKLNNKKGVELTLNMIVILIISLIVLVSLIYFFGGNFTEGSDQVKNISDSVLGEYKLP